MKQQQNPPLISNSEKVIGYKKVWKCPKCKGETNFIYSKDERVRMRIHQLCAEVMELKKVPVYER